VDLYRETTSHWPYIMWTCIERPLPIDHTSCASCPIESLKSCSCNTCLLYLQNGKLFEIVKMFKRTSILLFVLKYTQCVNVSELLEYIHGNLWDWTLSKFKEKWMPTAYKTDKSLLQLFLICQYMFLFNAILWHDSCGCFH